jgi:hypothetical protein
MRRHDYTLAPTWLETGLVLFFAALCSVQLFIPPFIGLASNGDFAKVHGRFACGPKDGGASNFTYFVPDYEFGPQYYWKSDVFSTENLLAAAPVLLVRATGARVFNIRWLGALHAALYIAAFYSLLLYLRRFGPARQFAVAAVATLLFCDVGYVAYFNSFFSDTAALLGAALMMTAALRLTAQDAPGRSDLFVFVMASALFIASKSQHAVWGFLPALFVLWITWRHAVRIAGILGCLILLAVEVSTFAASPADYKDYPLFNLIFYKLAPNSPEPPKTLLDLGLGEQEARLIGANAYSPGSPMMDSQWREQFERRTGYGKVLGYYLRHPDRALKVLYSDLSQWGPRMRQMNLSNFRKEDGRPPLAMTGRFALWSGFEQRVGLRWPWLFPAWYLAVIGACLYALARRPGVGRAAVLCLGIAAMGFLEFCCASLADACETDRHLLLFHVFTDATIVALAIAIAARAGKPRSHKVELEQAAPVR